MKPKETKTNVRGPLTPLRIFGRILAGIGATILLLILIAVLLTSYDNYRGHKKITKRYDAAAQQCGTQPVVVIKEIDFYHMERVHAYAPRHPDYQLKAKFYSNYNFLSNEEWVDAYFCTMEEVEHHYGDLERDPYNYPEGEH